MRSNSLSELNPLLRANILSGHVLVRGRFEMKKTGPDRNGSESLLDVALERLKDVRNYKKVEES